MSTPVNPQLPQQPAPPPLDPMELLKFLREQAEANRNALREDALANRAAQSQESESVRKLFTVTSSIVAVPLAVALTLAGIFWFRDMNTMKQAMKQEGEAAAKLEIQKMDRHIDDTLQAQFSTKSMQDRIDRAAEIATEGKAKSLIEDRVRAMTGPIQKQAQASLAAIHIQELIALANADDAKAFDKLLALKTTAPPDQLKLINPVIADRNFTVPSNMRRIGSKCLDPESSEVLASLESKDVEVRKATIAGCVIWGQKKAAGPASHPPNVSLLSIQVKLARTLVKVALRDSSLSVRAQAISGINQSFASSPGFPTDQLPLLETGALQAWWKANEGRSAMLLLLSRVESKDNTADNTENLDSVETYNELQQFEIDADANLKHDADEALSRMRSVARKRPELMRDSLPADWKQPYTSNSCTDISNDLAQLLPQAAEHLPSDASKSGGVVHSIILELEYLPSCPIDHNLMQIIENCAATTASLSGRYYALAVLKKDTGANIDAFDTKAFERWRALHNSTK